MTADCNGWRMAETATALTVAEVEKETEKETEQTEKDEKEDEATETRGKELTDSDSAAPVEPVQNGRSTAEPPEDTRPTPAEGGIAVEPATEDGGKGAPETNAKAAEKADSAESQKAPESNRGATGPPAAATPPSAKKKPTRSDIDLLQGKVTSDWDLLGTGC